MPESIDFPRNLPEPGNIDRVEGVGHQPNESEKKRFAQLLEKEKEGEREETPPPAEKKKKEDEPSQETSPSNGRGKFIDVTV